MPIRKQFLTIIISLLLLIITYSNISAYSTNTEMHSSYYNPNILYVGGLGSHNYTTIQQALINATTGDTIYVYDDSSPYNEHLIITIPITLKGENPSTTHIIGIDFKHIIEIYASDIYIDGFTFTTVENSTTKAAIYNNLGWWTDGKGNKLFQPSEFELIAKGLLGIQPNKLDDYYNIKRNQAEYDREIRDITDDYYKHVNNLVDSALDDYEAGIFDETKAAFDAQLKIHSAIINQHGEDADLIKLQLQRKISNNIDKNGFDELTRNLQKLALQNGRSSNAESIVNRAISAGFITPEQKDTYVEFTNTLMGEE